MKLPNNFRLRCAALTQRENLISHTDPLGIQDFGLLLVHFWSRVSSVNTWWATFLYLTISFSEYDDTGPPDLGKRARYSMTKGVLLLYMM
jgi:hypothetical protein